MISLEVYKFLHIVGLLMTFSGLAGMWGTRIIAPSKDKSLDRYLSAVHGIGLLIILVSGFGLLARLGLVQGLPNWIYVKLVVWVGIGGFLALIKRKMEWGLKLMTGWILLGMLAGYMGIFKPF